MTTRLVGIYRYPVKGLSADPLPSVDLRPGEALPYDRAYAIENGAGRFDPYTARHVPKGNFVTLMSHADLATIRAVFDPASATLAIVRDGGQVAMGNLATPAGRAIVAQFFAEYLKGDLRGPLRVVHAEGLSLSDMAEKCLHLVNLASVADLERIVAHPLDPLRFRPNLVVTGAPSWSELQWIGKAIRIGGTTLEVFQRTERCAASNVNPATGRRDLDIPALLRRRFGHSDFGVYARVTGGGRIAGGDIVTVN